MKASALIYTIFKLIMLKNLAIIQIIKNYKHREIYEKKKQYKINKNYN